MSDHHDPVLAELCAIRELLSSPAEPPWICPVHFSGPKSIFRQTEDRGPSAASYGIYNPIEAKVYLGLFGATPSPGDGFPVPAESALILPLRVSAQLEIGVDEAELGAETGTIYVIRFRTPQPFFLGVI